ncbi:hypothetical protein BW731_10865 [Vagococcus martis]|uniref:ABC transporter domain-containing protein n=1 Tax=Vagococcus martis TaxID=1768210 RepID=A0A1V4DJJ9_9ENTE|nr:ATP-binding cassette domain-containing protein [Vagococcus martis]OPF88631.1 hypothetical protein BW731_10865 [Vagococcus martis]
MIQLNQVTLIRDEKKVLDNINLTVRSGELVVLTGESGSGKSSLISVLNGLIPELYDGEIFGQLTVLDTPLPPIDFNKYVKDIGVVFQNPKTQFFTTSVLSELAFSMENYGFSAEDINTRMNDVIELFHLEDLIGKKVTELSGGQKQRIAFASACMLPHRLFLFDEPSSNLDYVTIKQLSDYIKLLKQRGCTLIISEHRLFYLSELADRYVILKNGKLTYDLPAAQFKAQFPIIQEEMGLRSLQEPKLLKSFVEKTEPDDVSRVLQIKDLTYQYSDRKSVLNIPSLDISIDNIVGLVGQNGSGKTTFVQLLSGLLTDKSHSFSIMGANLSAKERIARSFIVMQDVNLQLFFETVEKELLVQSKRTELFDDVVDDLNLRGLLSSHPQNLSGGEKQRVAIASAILSGKEWLILDEPTSGLDYQNMLAVSKLLKKAQSLGLFVLVISHDNELLSQTASCILKMDNGRFIS